MTENTAPARCTEAEYEHARTAGLLVVTTREEIAIHRFAESIRTDATRLLAEKEAELKGAYELLHQTEDRLIAKEAQVQALREDLKLIAESIHENEDWLRAIASAALKP